MIEWRKQKKMDSFARGKTIGKPEVMGIPMIVNSNVWKYWIRTWSRTEKQQAHQFQPTRIPRIHIAFLGDLSAPFRILGIPRSFVVCSALMVWVAAGSSIPRVAVADDLRQVFTIEREEIESSGIPNVFDLLYERAGINTYGTNHSKLFGWSHTVVLLNGRPLPNVAVSYTLEALPLSAVERIEILKDNRAVSVGENAIGGAVNIVLRSDFEGTEIRTGIGRPGLKGGDSDHASLLWGGPLGKGHLMIGVDRIGNQQIIDADRRYSRAEYNRGGRTDFSNTVGVSDLGNTVFYQDNNGNLKSAELGNCDGEGYVKIQNPRDAVGDGCGFAYADISWQTERFERDGTFLIFDHPLGEDAEVYLEARYAMGNSLFRYAPSPDLLRFESSDPAFNTIISQLDASTAAEISSAGVLQLGHRFVGHGNRDWGWDIREHDVTLGMRGIFADGIGYDAYIRGYRQELDEASNTFVNGIEVRNQINDGKYDLTNPLSTDPVHQQAIADSSLEHTRIASTKRRSAGIELSGTINPFYGRDLDWTLGIEAEFRNLNNRFRYRDASDNQVEASDVLGSGGLPVSGERKRRSGFSEIVIPITKRWDVQVAGRFDSFNDAGTTRNHDISTRFQINDRLAIRGALSKGEAVPTIYAMNADPSTTHPYVSVNGSLLQVERTTSGNPNLKPYDTESFNLGFAYKLGAFEMNVDGFRVKQSDRPSVASTQSIINLYESSGAAGLPDGVMVNPEVADYTVTGPWANILSTATSGVDMRLRTGWQLGSVDYTLDTRWLRVTDSKSGEYGGLEQDSLNPRDRIHSSVRASIDSLTFGWSVTHNSKFKSNLVNDFYPSWTGHDISLTWRDALGVEGLVATGGVLNLTDEGPPTVPSSPGLIASSYDTRLGRTLFLTTKVSW